MAEHTAAVIPFFPKRKTIKTAIKAFSWNIPLHMLARRNACTRENRGAEGEGRGGDSVPLWTALEETVHGFGR